MEEIIGQSYLICTECGNSFEVDLKEAQEADQDDIWCQDCCEMHEPDDRYYDDHGDYDIDFADPGGSSALRAEHGVLNGHCVSCGFDADLGDNFCRHCGSRFNQRNRPCPDCGTEDVLTAEDVELHYCCNACSDRVERDSD